MRWDSVGFPSKGVNLTGNHGGLMGIQMLLNKHSGRLREWKTVHLLPYFKDINIFIKEN